MSGEFSGKTLHYWGILRPDGTAATENPLERGNWKHDVSLSIAGYPTTDTNDDAHERSNALRGAQVLADRLVELGVEATVAAHKVVLFEVVTSVQATKAVTP